MNLKRREFIRISGITVAGSMIIPSVLQSCKGAPVSDTAAGYLDHFEVTPEILQKVIAAAMEKGADYADLFFEHTLNNRSHSGRRKSQQCIFQCWFWRRHQGTERRPDRICLF